MRSLAFAVEIGAIALLLTLAGCGSNLDTSSALPPVPADPIAPTVAITSPSSSGSFSTTSTAVAVAGTAADNVGVVSVSWRNAATGATGNATGTSPSWSIPSVALVLGVNTITVTARDTSGNAGNATLAVTYNPGGTISLSGNVDSSLINRSDTAVNSVYLYSGSVAPGSTAPVATAVVTQDNGACTFSYRFGALPAGTYTAALSSDGATFRGTSLLTLPGNHDFSPAGARWQVGPTRSLKFPSDAAAVAQSGDVIEIDAGQYLDDIVVWRQNNLTLRGVGGRAHIHSTQIIPFDGTDTGNGKGIWVQSAQNTTVENIELSGAAVSVNDGENGAGIRADGTGLTVCNGYFHDNQNGILGGAGVVLVEYSEFAHNGHCPASGQGCTHNMYFSNDVTRFTLRYSYSHHAHTGHTVKSRAVENYILYNRIMDETDGDASYKIDIPNAGRTFIIGNLVQRGLSSQNSTMVAYGEEGAINGVQALYVVNNTFVNDAGLPGSFFSIVGGTTVRLVNNIFAGGGSVPAASANITLSNNLVSAQTSQVGLANPATFDYRLTSAATSAINKGVDPGSVGGVSLVPTSQYLHPTNREDRPVDAVIDIGAYEFQ